MILTLLNCSAMSFVCQPAPSIMTTAWRSFSVTAEICLRCSTIMSLLTQGTTIASPIPLAGHTEPNKYAYSNCCCFTALGLEPRLAQSRVVVFCWPNLASSWNQTSTLSSPIWPGILRIVAILNFFKIVLDLLGLARVLRAWSYPREAHVIKQIVDRIWMVVLAKLFDDISMNISTS